MAISAHKKHGDVVGVDGSEGVNGIGGWRVIKFDEARNTLILIIFTRTCCGPAWNRVRYRVFVDVERVENYLKYSFVGDIIFDLRFESYVIMFFKHYDMMGWEGECKIYRSNNYVRMKA